MPDIVSALERRWFSIHGPPASIGCDVELSRSLQFRDFLKYFSVNLAARPAGRHN